ncbi:MAG: hypothetical protein WC456_03665 [Patescibacteria group bacterium]
MKKKYLLGLGILSFLALAAGATTVLAADSSTGATFGRGKNNAPRECNLTEAQKTEMEAKRAAIDTALKNGDYTAWAAAVKAIHADSPILEKISASNFSQYAEAYKLRVQADSIMKNLGLSRPGDGLMMGAYLGQGRGHGRLGQGAVTASATVGQQ